MNSELNNFSNARKLVMDPCADIFSTANASMLVPKHYQCIGREKYKLYFGESRVQMVEVVARQVLNEASGVQGG